MHGLKDVLKVEYNDALKNASKLHGFPDTSWANTPWHFVSVRKILGENMQFGGIHVSVWIIILLSKHLSNYMHFLTNAFKHFFID